MFYVELRFDDLIGSHIIRSLGISSLKGCHRFVNTCIENFSIVKGYFTIYKYREDKEDFVIQGEYRF